MSKKQFHDTRQREKSDSWQMGPLAIQTSTVPTCWVAPHEEGPVTGPRADTVPSIARNLAVYFGNGYWQGPAMERHKANY